MAVFAIFGILFVAAGVLFWVGKYAQERSVRLYRMLGERVGLEMVVPPTRLAGFVRPEPYLTGEVEGREAIISAGERGPGGIRQIETVIKLQTTTGKFRLQVLRRGGSLSKVAGFRKDGLKKFSTGIPEFDELFELRGNHAATVKGFVGDPEVRATLTSLLAETSDLFLISGDTFVFAKNSILTSPADVERMESALAAVTKLSKIFRAGSVIAPESDLKA